MGRGGEDLDIIHLLLLYKFVACGICMSAALHLILMDFHTVTCFLRYLREECSGLEKWISLESSYRTSLRTEFGPTDSH